MRKSNENNSDTIRNKDVQLTHISRYSQNTCGKCGYFSQLPTESHSTRSLKNCKKAHCSFREETIKSLYGNDPCVCAVSSGSRISPTVRPAEKEFRFKFNLFENCNDSGNNLERVNLAR